MAASLLGRAVVGAVFGELMNAVLKIMEIRNKVRMFKQDLVYLQSTQLAIAPVIKEIEQHNNDLGRPKEEVESLIRKMKEGINLVYECSKTRRYNYIARSRHQKQLVALEDSLARFFSIDMQAQTLRDQKETLLKVTRILSAVNIFHLVDREDTRATSSGSAKKVMEPITGTKQEAGQSKAKAENNQGMKQNNEFYIEDDETSYNEQVRQNKQVFLDSSYSFDLEDLQRASTEVLGEGSYGTTFKSTLEDGRAILAWKWLREIKVSETEFERQMEILITLLPKHPNVCSLRAYSSSSDEKLLIYDYIVGDSFSALMHGSTQLDWKSRMKISLGAARGIAHIHSVRGVTFVHGNIKSSNVLVTTDFQGCISDFGLTCLLPLSFIPSANKGYQAPEAIEIGKMTQRSDVYTFGILLLEMLTGKSPEEDLDLASWVEIQAMDGLSYALFDDALIDDIGYGDVGVHMMTLARDCASMVPYMKPSMTQ